MHFDFALGGGIAQANLSSSTHWKAKECVLYPGVRRISARVLNGVYEEAIDKVHPGDAESASRMWTRWTNNYWNSSSIPWGDFVIVRRQPLAWPSGPAGPKKTSFGLSREAVNGIMMFFHDLFHGSAAIAGDSLGFYIRESGGSASTAATQDILQSILYGNIAGCSSDQDHMECALENVARAITKSFRDDAFIKFGYPKADMAIGNSLVEQTFIRIQWPWLALPLSVWILSVGLWIMTVFRTLNRGIPMWRNNPLPMLFLYRPSEDEASLMNGGTSSLAYTRRARKLLGQLRATKVVKEPKID